MRGQIDRSMGYILCVILASVIALIGYNAVEWAVDSTQGIQGVEFRNELSKSLQEPGEHTLKVPAGEKVCFVDADIIGHAGFDPQTYYVDPEIARSIRTGDTHNVFIMDDGILQSFEVAAFSVPRHVLCKQIQGTVITLNTEGNGIQ